MDGRGKTSFEDWPMLTWSFGCTPSPARAAITSFAFVFGSSRNRSGRRRSGTGRRLAGRDAIAGGRIRRRIGIEQPELGVHPAAAALMRPSQRATERGIGSPRREVGTAFRFQAPAFRSWYRHHNVCKRPPQRPLKRRGTMRSPPVSRSYEDR